MPKWKPKPPRKGARHCPVCGSRAPIRNVRNGTGYVRRRYDCTCGERWTTVEVRVGGEGVAKDKAKMFFDAIREEGAERVRSELRALLESGSHRLLREAIDEGRRLARE